MQKNDNNIDLRRFIRTFKQHKWTFAIIVVIFTSLGVWKGLRSLPKYDIEGSMLIGDNSYETESKGGGIAQMMKTFSVGGFSASSVDNEVLILKSHDVLMRAVRLLDLNRTYIGKDKNGKKALLYKNTPVKVEAPAVRFDTLSEVLIADIQLRGENKADIELSEAKFLHKKQLKKVENVTLPYMLESPYGAFQIIATRAAATTPYSNIKVTITNNNATIKGLDDNLTIDVASKLSDIIDIDYQCANDSLGMATVNAIMNEYNAKRLTRLHETAETSIRYYDERIAETFRLLQESEQDISDFQRKNELMGVDSEVELLVENSVGAKKDIQTAYYNIAYYETVLDILRNRLDDDVLIPQMESLNDPNIVSLNELVGAKKDLKRSATDDNDALKLINERIRDLSGLIIENSEKMIAKAKADVRHQESMAAAARGRLDEYPDYQTEFVNLLRGKEFQNQLYLYLMQQRENSVLRLYSNTDIGFIYQPAYVVKKAGILKKMIWPAVMLGLSIFFILCITIMLTWCSRKVKAPMDLAFIGIDNNSISYDGEQEQINMLRTKITADPGRRIIYWAALDGTQNAMTDFAGSLTAIGRNVDSITGLASNNELLTPDMQGRITAALDSAADYVIANIPNPENVADIENAVDAAGACLIVSLPYNKILRKRLKAILKGLTADKVYAVIVK